MSTLLRKILQARIDESKNESEDLQEQFLNESSEDVKKHPPGTVVHPFRYGRYGDIRHLNPLTVVKHTDTSTKLFDSNGDTVRITHRTGKMRRQGSDYSSEVHGFHTTQEKEAHLKGIRDENDADEKKRNDTLKLAKKENHPVHKEIIEKLKKSGDQHLKNLSEPEHKLDSYGTYRGSESSSKVDSGGFNELFHHITKDVTIHNASSEDRAQHGITHHGSISYSYKHPGGGSNGKTVGRFWRKTDGSIELRKTISTPNGDSDEKITHLK